MQAAESAQAREMAELNAMRASFERFRNRTAQNEPNAAAPAAANAAKGTAA